MADIFVSYKSEERDRVEPLVRFLEHQGWSVFWDRKTPPGKDWDTWIGQNLTDAKCVVVVWTEQSKVSPWIREEANYGKGRGILLPVKLDAVEPPFGFTLIQAADLTTWQGQRWARRKSFRSCPIWWGRRANRSAGWRPRGG